MDGKIKPTDQEIQETMSKVSKMISDIQLETLSTVPLWMRMNYILRQIGTGIEKGYTDEDFKWDLINDIMTRNLDPFDYNLYEPVRSIEEFNKCKFNMVAAEGGIGPWQKHKCKDCGEEFYMDFKEVQFYKGKELHLPKRCKECRAKRKKGN